MADFLEAVTITLLHEGGFVDNPKDPGGATKYGITQKDLPDKNIRDITAKDAIEYYAEHYWKPLYNQIHDQVLANKIFDMGVLFGVGTAVKALQLALGLKVDGVFGPMTLQEVNSDDPSLIHAYQLELQKHCLAVVQANPETKEFLNGWLNRINS